MKLLQKKIRVVHIPQVPMKGFNVEVNNEREAYLIEQTLADQHNFLFDENVIPDYSNVIIVQMLEDGEWTAYYNEDEMTDWEEFCEEYDAYVKGEAIIGSDVDHLSDGDYIGGLTK